MLATMFAKNTKLGGPDGGGVLVREVAFVERKARTKLAFACEAATQQVRGEWVPLDGDDTEVTVEMDVGMPDGTNALTEKKLQRQNGILAALAGEPIDPGDQLAWLEFLPGGRHHDRVVGTDKLAVTVNEWNDWKSFEFVPPRPPRVSKDDVLARWAARQEAQAGADAAASAADVAF